MSDFTLKPDELEPDRPEHARPMRPVATGLAPTAEPPMSRKKAAPPCYAPCPRCRAMVLTDKAPAGHAVTVEPGVQTYTVVWANGAPEPTLHESRGYPAHRCWRE